MALYKYAHYLGLNDNVAFDTELAPGTRVPNSGIYRCMGCNREIAANEGGDPLPPQNHHQHAPAQGRIRWKLTVFAQN